MSELRPVSRTSYPTRFSYASTDIACQLVFAPISFYLLKFYTDVYGLAAGVAGTIMLVARFIDAADAPLWGILFERTRSRWGKIRPWFLWLCGPFALFGILTFVTPDLEGSAKIAYAAGTYILVNILYTGINTPVTAILAVLTANPQERVVLTCFRMFGSKLGVLLVNLSFMKLVGWLGEGDDRRGYLLTVPIYCAVAVGLFLLAFRNLKEVVPTEEKRTPMLSGFGALRGNWPWWIIATSSLLFWIAFIARVAAAPYFFEYTLGRADLIPLAFALDFISLGTVLGLPWLCRTFSKTTVWAAGLAGLIVGQLIMAWGLAQGNSLPIVMTGWALGFLASGAAMAMPFSILSDSVDYGEWKTGIRAAGLLAAIGAAFCLKAGAGLGGALPGWILQACDYVPKAAQTATVLRGIEFSVVWLPAIAFAAALGPVLFYGKYERQEAQIHADLTARRETGK
ncbi:MFS transporter [Oleiharenicola lentus]|uniref:MFS transporter n=1 Tax=Oleiharenicola lentus TaxID=2508720 RepID=A0A4Q1C5K5_9BACT|nr:MFS transporter [Oleiharenicola lentus]